MGTLPNLPSSSNLILGLIGEIFKIFSGKISRKSANDLGEALLALLCVAILFAIATAPFKILLRKNFGKNAISVLEVIFGSLFFVLCALTNLVFILDPMRIDTGNYYEMYFTNPYVLGLISTILFSIGIFTLTKGLRENSKHHFSTKIDWIADNYRGDSILYQNYITDNETMCRIWRIVEPGFCFKWSFVLLIIHPILGIPLLFTSVAFWVNEYYHVHFKWEKLIFENQSTGIQKNDTFGSRNLVSS
jgi:uncharacterized membrane protein